MLTGAGFLGTGASLGADITLLVQILFFFGLSLGVVAQLLHKHRLHDFIQIPIVTLNWFFIIFIMVSSMLRQEVATTLPGELTNLYYVTPFIHAGLGLTAQLLATYCMLAGLKILPRKIGTLRYFMWATYAFWIMAVTFGLGTYIAWYVLDTGKPAEVTQVVFEQAAADQPAVQRALLQSFAFQPEELTVVAGTTVVWVNQDGALHNVTFADGSAASKNFRQGEVFEFTFDEPGVYPVYCSLHGNPTSGMIGTVTVVEATDENIAQFGGPSTVTVLPPTPTALPPVPLAPLALIEPPSPEDTVLGLLAFRDNLSPSDSVTLALGGIEPVPAGSELHVWLTGSDSRVLDIGRVEPNSQGSISFSYTDPFHQNLMGRYDGLQITFEPAGDADPAPGDIHYSGRQAAAANEYIRLITAAAAGTPLGQGYGSGARLQAEELTRHAQYIQLAYDLGSIADAQRHAEHIVNILEGEGGEFFGDHDGAHGLQNPGDGYGLIPYIDGLLSSAEAAAAAADATKAIQTHAGHVAIAGGNALASALAVRDAALQILDAGGIGEISPQVETISRLSLRTLVGEDLDGDGVVALPEGGVFTAYQHAQYMGAIGVLAGAAAGVADPITVGGQETLLASGEIVIDMFEFQYSQKTLTIPAGAQVRFVNRGQARHSATADDGSFDTGLLDPGEEAVVVFEEIGFFPYYCALHGTRGGVGMAASITVVEAGTEIPTVAPTSTAPLPTAPPAAAPTQAPAVPTPTLRPTPGGPAPTAAAPPAATEPSATTAPPPTPTKAPPPAQPAAFQIDMLDFTYSSLDMQIPAGSTVTFVNAGNARHSATADDGSWDTGLLASGGQVSITFDKPGVFPYYCVLHGSPGGFGMSATLTVTP